MKKRNTNSTRHKSRFGETHPETKNIKVIAEVLDGSTEKQQRRNKI